MFRRRLVPAVILLLAVAILFDRPRSLHFYLGVTSAAAQTPGKKNVTQDDVAIKMLIAQLGDEVYEKREAAQKRLTEIGAPALPALKTAANKNTDPEVRARAKDLVQKIAATFFVEVRRLRVLSKEGLPWANRLAIAPDGKQIFATGFGALQCWHVESGKEGVAFEWPEKLFSWGLDVSPNGQQVLAGGEGKVVRVLDIKSGKVVRELLGHTGYVWGAAFSKDGRRAVSGGWDESLRLWDLATGKEIRSFPNVRGKVRCLAISPDGKLVAAGLFDARGKGTLGIWELETGKPVHALEGHTREITSVRFSPNGSTVMTSSFDATVRLWDVARGKESKRFTGHLGRVEFAAFTPDGKHAVSCGNFEDPVVRLWEIDTCGEILHSPETEGFLSIIAFPDGRHFASAGKDGLVRVWRWKR